MKIRIQKIQLIVTLLFLVQACGIHAEGVPFAEVNLSRGTLDDGAGAKRIHEAEAFYGTKKAIVLAFQKRSLFDGDFVIPLPEKRVATLRIRNDGDAEVWKGYHNGKIRMSLRKAGKSYTGYLVSGGKHYSIVGIDEEKFALIERDPNFECGAKGE